MLQKKLQTLALCSAVAALCGVGQEASAHTSVTKQQTESTADYNALQIGHGCTIATGKLDANGDPIEKKIPVIAQSVVFPTLSPVVQKVTTHYGADGKPDNTTTADTTLAAEIDDSANANIYFAGKADLVQDRNIFKAQDEKYVTLPDKDGKLTEYLIGFYAAKGNLQPNLRGLVPFRFSPVKFKAGTCAKRVLVRLAVADICKMKFPPTPETANLWIPANTANANDPINSDLAKIPGIDGIGSPATLTINRKTAPDASTAGGTCSNNGDGTYGYDVVVTPSATDVDTNLPFKGWGD